MKPPDGYRLVDTYWTPDHSTLTLGWHVQVYEDYFGRRWACRSYGVKP